MFMKKLGLLFLLFFLSQPMLATSIVVLITSEYIIIGADSKRMILDAEGNQTRIETACKIQMIGSYCYAAAGLTSAQATKFSVNELVQKELRKNVAPAKAIKNIQRQVKRALKKELVYQKKQQPKQFAKLMEAKQHLLEIVVLQVTNHVPQAYLIGFAATDGAVLEVTTYTTACTTGCASVTPQLLLVGEYTAMENYLQAPAPTTDPVAFINQLLLTQARLTPGTVGSPFSMLKLKASGIEWINTHCSQTL